MTHLLGYGGLRALGKAIGAIVFALFFAPLAMAQDRSVIVAFGDSLTQGYGLPAEQGFVPQLQAWLEAKDLDAQLINAGVSGDTTAGGAARIAWTLSEEVDGIIVALGGNDLLRGIDPAVSRANLEAILQECSAREIAVLLVGMTAPGNYGAEYKAEFDRIYPDLSAQYDTGFAPSFFIGLQDASGVVNPADVTRLMQSDGIHPNAQGVTRIVEGLGPFVTELLGQIQGASSLEKS